jgi:cyanate lyase
MTRAEATELILDAKRTRGLTFREIAEQLGSDPVYAGSCRGEG